MKEATGPRVPGCFGVGGLGLEESLGDSEHLG